MKTLFNFIIIISMSIVALEDQENSGHDVKVYVKNLKSDKGHVFIALYNKESSFLSEGFKAEKIEISNRNSEVIFKNIQPGIYAVSFFHDDNDNGKMDTNFLGIPKEDYGCSNNAKGFMGPPKWEDAKFEVKNEPITQIITL